MGRTQRALTSLVAAIPAGFLAYLLVMVFLNSADKLTTITQVLTGLTLACAAFVTLMPFGLLIFGGAKKAVAAGSAKSEAVVANDDEEVVEEAAEADSEETSAFDADESDADIMSDSDDEIESGPASSLDEIESVDFDDDDDEPAPKKRKK